MQPFAERLHLNGNGLKRRAIDVLQVNLGRYCNLACIHCHVEAGPTRKEMMSRENVDAVLRFLASTNIPTLDITGGAPELHADFDYLVESARGIGPACDGSLQSDGDLRAGQRLLAGVFSPPSGRIGLFATLLFDENVDKQRGKGTFDGEHSRVANFQPTRLRPAGQRFDVKSGLQSCGPHLPPPQEQLEAGLQANSREQFGIEFNHLFCLTNMPITRYATHLKLRGEYDRTWNCWKTTSTPPPSTK